MRFKPQKYRSFLLRGTAALATTLLLFAGLGCYNGKSTGTNAEQPTIETIYVVTTTTTTKTTTTTNTTTSLTTTSERTTTTEVIPAITEVVTEPETVAKIETTTEPPKSEQHLPITEQEWTLIANVVSHEAGCSWIGEYERACIVAAIMNRVKDPRFPNTIDAVLHQPYQFFNVPYYRVDYSGIGYEPIDNAIRAYFSGKYNCGSINSWSGNGHGNHFYYQ